MLNFEFCGVGFCILNKLKSLVWMNFFKDVGGY